MGISTVVGLVAAFCTTVSYYPQLRKCWQTRTAGDLSLKMFITLATGVALWIVYGALQGGILVVKIREERATA
jgi:MtN3 and saliva related transmembrane protein